VADIPSPAQIRDLMPFAVLIGVELLETGRELVRGRIAWSPEHCTTGGVMHGAVVMALADTCGGVCAFLNLPEGATGTATIESKTNFFRPVREGYVEAVSTPLHVGRTTIVVQTDVLDAQGKRVARVTQTQAVFLPAS
jgi:uncharacterized protein (TIGR00369 family)